MDQYVQGTLTILSLVKPVICGTMFSKIAVDKPSAARIFLATHASATIAAILCLAALWGTVSYCKCSESHWVHFRRHCADLGGVNHAQRDSLTNDRNRV